MGTPDRRQDPVLEAVAQAAVTVAGAARAWLIAPTPAGAFVVLAAAGERADQALWRALEGGIGPQVIDSGQPVALSTGSAGGAGSEPFSDPLGEAPRCVLCVPCVAGAAVRGALQLSDKPGADRFTIDDLELVTMLSTIAAAAIVGDSGAQGAGGA